MDAGALGPVPAVDRGDAAGLLARSTQGAVPIGTRSIGVALNLTRTAGSYNDGHADNLSLVLQPGQASGVPEPVSWALMIAGLGAAGLALRRSRRPAAGIA